VSHIIATYITLPWQNEPDDPSYRCKAFVGKEMIKRRSGKIINISSRGGHAVIPLSASYGASKAGLQMLTKALAVEWGKNNINVNSVSPGVTETGKMPIR
jgi:NAD(P)-dependent dehydrogenase (short-subunit alcohol dehydrogenase family)